MWIEGDNAKNSLDSKKFGAVSLTNEWLTFKI